MSDTEVAQTAGGQSSKLPQAYGLYAPQVVGTEYQPAPSHLHYEHPPTVIVQQPQLTIEQHGAAGVKPSNYLAFSIVNMICCCFILGIIALVYSIQVDSAWSSRQYDEARHNAKTAKVLNIVGLSIGISAWVISGIIIIIYIILIFAAVGSASTSSNSANSYNSYSY